MSRTELRCDAPKEFSHPDFTKYTGKCGHMLARSPELGERVQWNTLRGEWTGKVWLVDHDRHLASVQPETLDNVALGRTDADSQVVGWTALRPCNGSPVR